MENLDSYIDKYNNLYIHLNNLHIGSRISSGSKNLNFSELRKQMVDQLKLQYMSLLSEKIHIPGETLKTLSDSMNITEEELITEIDKEIKKKLQKDINVSKLQTLFDTVKNGNLNQHLEAAINQKSIEELNSALEVISKCLDLLEGKNNEGKSLGAALTLSMQNSNSFVEVGNKLEKELNEWKKNNNLKLIKRQSLEASYNSLQNLSYVLQTGTFKSTGQNLTADGMRKLLSNGLISTNIAEGLAFSMRSKADSILRGVVAQSVGTQAVTIKYEDGVSGSITSKTDVLLPKVKIKLENLSDEISVDIGISSKFYTGKPFLGNSGKEAGSFGSGSGGTLKEALSTIFLNANQNKYLAYNYLAHNENQKEMKDLILTRQLLRLFATMGSSEDFSQYMLVNGKVISIWQLVRYIALDNLDEKEKNGITLSISSKKSFKPVEKHQRRGESVKEVAWQRAREQNSIINEAKIFAKIHLKNLARAMANKEIT